MRIKLKVKHVFGLLIAFAAALFIFVNWIYPPVSSEAKSPYEAIERLESDQIFVQGRMSYIEEKIINTSHTPWFDVFKSTTGSASANFLGEEEIPLEVSAPYIKEYLEDGYKDKGYTDAIRLYSLYFFKKGDLKQAIDVVEKYLENYPSQNEGYWETYFLNVQLHEINDNSKALELVNALSSAQYALLPEKLKAEAQKVEVNQLLHQEKYQEVELKLRDYLTSDGWRQGAGEFLENTRRNLNRWMDGKADLHKVSGRVTTDDGKPVANSIVYVKPEEDMNMFESGEELSYPHAYTDEEGYYTIYGVPTGQYAFFFATQFDQVKGYAWPEFDRIYNVDQDVTWRPELRTLIKTYKPTNFASVNEEELTFDWERVDGAAYYRVLIEKHVDSGSTTSVFQEIDTDELTVSVEELYDFMGGVSIYGEEEHDGHPIPESLLALAYPDAELSWSVVAYNEKGEYLSSSKGFRLTPDQDANVPFFSLEERELTEADKALLNHEYERAESLYKQKGDPHSLKMYIRLNQFKKESGDLLPAKKEYARKADVPGAWWNLAREASTRHNWDLYFEAMDHVLKDDPFIESYNRDSYATALAKNGRYEEAEKWFKQAAELSEDHAIRKWTALKLYREGFDAALAIADRYPSYHRHFDEMEFGDWSSLLSAVEEKASDASTSELLEQGLRVYFSPDQDIEGWMEENELPDVIETFFEEM